MIVVDLGVFFWFGASGLGAVAFLLTLGICGYAMFRTWRDQRSYGMRADGSSRGPGYGARTRADAPSSASRHARISASCPTKIGVSRSV